MSTRFGSFSWVTHEVRGQRVLDRLAEELAHGAVTAPDRSRGFALRGLRVEYRAVADLVPGHHGRQRGPWYVRGGRVDLGHHGLVARHEFVSLELGQGVLVGHLGEAESRAAVADVELVVELVVVVKVRAGCPVPVVSRVVGDRVPSGLVEGVAEGEPLAGEELVIPLLAINPEP